jgi:hypothetical protein
MDNHTPVRFWTRAEAERSDGRGMRLMIGLYQEGLTCDA